MSSTEKQEKTNNGFYIIFVSLLLDLLAFTMILPLFPSLLEHYRLNDESGLYLWLSNNINYFRESVGAPEKFNSVLFGGFLGSMFSFLQFLASPVVGGLSDVIGRKPMMIICLIGISFSYVIWALSTNLAVFILARFIGGISKGNISLSMTIITDISTVNNRGKGMALVGVAFSLGFIVGPMIGAVFAVWAKNRTDSWFIYPALFGFVLTLTNLIYFTIYFKESLPTEKRVKSLKNSFNNTKAYLYIHNIFLFTAITNIKQKERNELRKLGLIYFVYLFIYSGLEFTLTFLTHHTFNYTSIEQGWMFCMIGLVMAIIQGGYVRRIPPTKIKATAIIGLWLIIPSFVCVGLAVSSTLLYLGLLLFALSTALVVPCMMTLASQYGTPQEKGAVLGIFRSLGALARAIGPIIASIAFWSVGSRLTYVTGAVGLLWPVIKLHNF